MHLEFDPLSRAYKFSLLTTYRYCSFTLPVLKRSVYLHCTTELMLIHFSITRTSAKIIVTADFAFAMPEKSNYRAAACDVTSGL